MRLTPLLFGFAFPLLTACFDGPSSGGARGGASTGGAQIGTVRLDPEVGDKVTITASAPDAGAPTWSIVPATSGRIDAAGVLVAFEPGRLDVVASFGPGIEGRLALDVRAANPASFGEGRYIEGADNDSGENIVVDTDGSIYIAGSTAGGFGGNVGVAGTSDAFVARILPNGKLAWITMVTTNAIDGASGLALHPGGGVVATAGQLLTSVAVRIDRAGNTLWTRDLAGLGVNDIAVDKAGNSWLTGSADRASNYQVNALLGPPLGEIATRGASDGFLVELDPNGTPLEGKLFTWFNPDQQPGVRIPCFATDGTALALDEENGAVYVAGVIQANAFFGLSGWVRRFDLAMNEQWLRFNNSDGSGPNANDKDWHTSSPNLGTFTQSLAVGAGGTVYAGGTINNVTAVVTAFAGDGSMKWRAMPSAPELGPNVDAESVPALVYRPRHDDVIVVRMLAGDALMHSNAHSSFITSISAAGVIGASRRFGGEMLDNGMRLNSATLRSIRIDTNENLFATGDSTGSFFGTRGTPGPNGTPSLDAMVVRFSAD